MKALSLITGLLTAGCSTTQLMSGAVDATIINPSKSVTQELSDVTSAVTKRTIYIAPGVLMSAPVLTVDPPFNDRSYARPDKFYLKKSGATCALFHSKTETYYPLKSVQCAPHRARQSGDLRLQ